MLDLRTQAYIDHAIRMHDPVERRDFVLQANGGRVLTELTVPAPAGNTQKLLEQHPPTMALVDDIRVGQCWPFAGEKGQLGLKLSELMHPTHVTIDHIPLEFAADAGQAPREMVLWGAVDSPINEERLRASIPNATLLASINHSSPPVTHDFLYTPLASFEYNIHARSHVQTFSLDPYVERSGMDFGVMVLELLSNWGGDTTCLYRVRVHGKPCHDLR